MPGTSGNSGITPSSPQPPTRPGPAARAAAYLGSRRHLLWLAAIVLIALALRLAWISYADPNPNDGRFDDSVFYDISARTIAAWDGYRGFGLQQTAQWPPGYSAVLAVVYKLFGHNIYAAKMVNVAAGGIACVAVYALAAKVFSRRVGLLAALIFALFPSSIFFSTLLLTESIFAALLTLLALLVLMVLLERGGPLLPSLLLGVLFGAAALVRSEAAVLLLVALLFWKLATPSWRRFASPAGFLAAGAVLAVSPWTVRNAITMKALVPLSTGGGHTLLAGHQHDPYDPENAAPEADIQLEYALLPYPQRETEMEREATRRALEFMRDHPAYEAQLIFEKLYHLYENDSDSLNWIRGYFPRVAEGATPTVTIPPDEEETWKLVANTYYYAVMGLAFTGIPFWFSFRDKKRLLLALFVLGWTFAHLLFMPGSRYHTALMPLFSIWAAVALAFWMGQVMKAARATLGKTPND